MLVVATLVVATPLHAQQRISLADRVTRLELQADNSQANADLLNQLNQLRNEVQSLRQAVEQLQHENQQLQQSARDQYLDLDGRLNRLESGGAAPALPAPPSASAPAPSGNAPRAAAPAAQAGALSVEAPPSVHGDPGSLAQAGDERAAYDQAFNTMRGGQYAQSVQEFEAFLAQFPNGIYAPNALYWLGQSYYLTSRYAEAEQQFEAVVARYPTHPKAADSLLKLGLAQLETGKPELAARTLGEVGTRYPGTEAARIAGDRLGSISRRAY